MPATFGHWLHFHSDESGKNCPRYHSIDGLTKAYRSNILWRIGEEFKRSPEDDYMAIGQQVLEADPATYDRVRADPNWMRWVFEDYEIKVFRVIPPSRILRPLAGSAQSGRQRRREFKNRDTTNE